MNDIIHVEILDTDLSDNLGNHFDIRETVMRSRVRLDFSDFVKSMRPHNGNSDSKCEYVAQ